MNTLKTLTAAVALAALGAAAPSVFAQSNATSGAQGAAATQQGTATQQGSATQQGATGSMGAATTKISDSELEKFASAESKVSEIRTEFSEKLAEAESQEKAQSLQMEAQEKMVEAVRDEGMEIPKYNEIATRLQSDPELQQRVSSMN